MLNLFSHLPDSETDSWACSLGAEHSPSTGSPGFNHQHLKVVRVHV